MGAEGAYIPLIAAAIGAGGGIGTALLTPSNQERQSFRHTAFDPVDTNADTDRVIRGLLGDAMTRAKTPVELPNAIVSGDMPTFTGGGLPVPIGVTSRAPKNLQSSIPNPNVAAPGLMHPGPSPTPGGPAPTPGGPPKSTPYDPDPTPGAPPPKTGTPPRVTLPPPGDDHVAMSFLDGGPSGPTRNPLVPMTGGARSSAGATPAVPQLDPQARGAVQLLLQSIQGMQGGGGAGGYGGRA